jgi:hypothetical protein
MNTAEDLKNDLTQRFTDLDLQDEDYFEDGCRCGGDCGCHSEMVEDQCCQAGEEDHTCCRNH